MAEKKVSVRLAAEGGRVLRAELQGIGQTGEAALQRIGASAEMANRVLKRLAGVLVGAFSVRQVVAYADAWSDLGSRVALATGSQEKGAAVMERLAAMARRTYSGLNETAEGWLSMQRSLRDLGLTTRETLDFTEALNNAMVVSGAKAERAASVSSALARAMALGTLSGVNLNTVIAQGGRVAELLAAELGTTVSGLRQLGKDGRITGEVIRRALTGNLELLRAEADAMPATIGDAFTLIGNAALQLVGSWDRLTGASGMVAEALVAVADNIERLAAIALAFATFLAGRWVAAFVAARVATFTLAGALTALRAALIRTGIGALIVAAGELIYQFAALVKSVGGIGTAFRLLWGVAKEAGQRIVLAFRASFALLGAGWEGYKLAVLTVLDAVVGGVVTAADRVFAAFDGAFEAIKAIWGALPGAIGDFTFQAANGLIAGVEAMLNAVAARINIFIEGLNWALSALPQWAVGEEGIRIGLIDKVEVGRIDNPFENAATVAGTAAADAFAAALSRTHFEAPAVFGELAEEARTAASGYLDAAETLGRAAIAPMESWQALGNAVAAASEEGKSALDDAADAADRVTDALERSGRAGGRAGKEVKAGAEAALAGWDAVAKSLSDYADKAQGIGGDIGAALVGAFRGAEDAVAAFVKTGKLKVSELVTSLIADLARLGARKFILGPLAGALSGVLGNIGGGALAAALHHSGGMVGGPAPARMVPALAFAGAARLHAGGWAGLRPDEVPAILQRGERVLSRREVAAGLGGTGGNVTVNIQARDAESFRQSRAQIAADIARAVAFGRRGM